VDIVPVYETHPAPREVADRLRALLTTRGVDAITFTSASTVHAFCDAVGDGVVGLVKDSGAIVASIGPVTTEAAIARGLEVQATAVTYTLDGLMAVLEGAFTRVR
jgi:uroporphyrinogen III methyltransferase/synthase